MAISSFTESQSPCQPSDPKP